MHDAYSFHYLLIKVHTCGCIIFRFLITVRIVNLPRLIVKLPFEGVVHGLAAFKIVWRCLRNPNAQLYRYNLWHAEYDTSVDIPNTLTATESLADDYESRKKWNCITIASAFLPLSLSCILSHICCAICLILFQVSRLLFIMTFRPQQTEWLKPDKHTKL